MSTLSIPIYRVCISICSFTSFVFAEYENTNGTRECNGKESNKDDSELACQFKLSEIVGKSCSAENDYGYATGEPCVALSLNRLIGWNPVEYPANSVPEVVRDHDRYQAGSIAVHCDGEVCI
jgi:sodium/potassium-transporting ATPase subunit beta